MNHANIATHPANFRQTVIPAIAARFARALPASPRKAAAAYSPLPRQRHSNLRQVREEGGTYHPHRDDDDDRDRETADATRTSLSPLQSAQRHLDEAVNLLGLLLDAIEQDADARAEQVRTALELTVESLHQARRLMDEQDLLAEETDPTELEEEWPED